MSNALDQYAMEPTYKEPEYEAKYKCISCEQGFERGWKCEEEHFCSECKSGNKHLIFYRDQCGLNIRDIIRITTFNIKEIN